MSIGGLQRYDDVALARPLIERCVADHGWAAEHNASAFFASEEEPYIAKFFGSSEGWGVLTHDADGAWYLYAEPMAPPEARAGILANVLKEIFANSSTKKMVMELTTETRRMLLKKLPDGLRMRRIAETFLWPVLDLISVDCAFPGSRFKGLRNAQSRFMREHASEWRDVRDISPDALHGIVTRWKEGRRASHTGYVADYHGFIESEFAGCDGARALVVDGTPEALSAGWRIPHSDIYYYAMSLHSYAHWGLGEVVYMGDIAWLKSQGYARCDLGGSDKKLFAFKAQFGDVTAYKTHQFTVVRV